MLSCFVTETARPVLSADVPNSQLSCTVAQGCNLTALNPFHTLRYKPGTHLLTLRNVN